MKVHLVDGTFELFRAFYSAPSQKTAAGQEVGATFGYLRSLSALVSTPGVSHVAVAFDHVIESFRNDLFAGYKTGEGIDPALWSQAGLVEEVTDALGVVVWPMIDFEADDALATAARRWHEDPAVEQIVICSPDKDLCQCLTLPKVVTWDRIRNRTLDAASAQEKFGVAPGSIPDYLALVGDTADGIPGVPRWGAKSAAAVLSCYGNIDAIPEDPRQWRCNVRGAAALGEALNANREAARLYRTLATLRFDAPIEHSLDDLEYRGTHASRLKAVCERLGDSEVASRLSAKHGSR